MARATPARGWTRRSATRPPAREIRLRRRRPIELYQDGVLLATYVNSSDASVPAMTAIRLGLETHSANPASYDVYLDDVAMDSKPVGCP